MARTAAEHYQFESIHPFRDGNGRTGRALIAAGIADARLADIPACAVSVPILRHPQEYYDRLDAGRSADGLEARTVFLLQMMAQGTQMCLDRLAEQNAWAERKLEENANSARWSRRTQVHAARQALSLPWCRTADLLTPGGLTEGIVPFVVELRVTDSRSPLRGHHITPRQQPCRQAEPARPGHRPGAAYHGSPGPAGSASPPRPARSPPSVESSDHRASA